ncbi:MAG: ankyrin repeat domain-containing protein [Rickettsia sp.]|nr:ankyrin repeat domain-containing protein [Rickettsia sp.]
MDKKIDTQNNKNLTKDKDILKPELRNSNNKESLSDSTTSSSESSPRFGPSPQEDANKYDIQIQESVSTNASYTPEKKEINEEFLQAVLADDLNIVIEMLKNPALDVNVHADDSLCSSTALHIALNHRNTDMIKVILDHHNVDINVKDKFGNTPFAYAKVINLASINVLFNISGGKIVYTPPNYTPEEKKINEDFLEEVLSGNLSKVVEILKNPLLDVNFRETSNPYSTALQVAVSNTDIEMVKAILEHKDIDLEATSQLGSTALSHAAGIKSIEIIKMLFEKFPTLLVDDNAMYVAAMNNDLFIFKILLERCEDKNFIANHALKIFEEAGSIIDGNGGRMSIKFSKFIARELIEQTSPKEALKVCMKAIPFFGKYEPTYECCFAKDIIVPLFKKTLSNKALSDAFDNAITDEGIDEGIHTNLSMKYIKENLLYLGYLEEEDSFLVGDHSTT